MDSKNQADQIKNRTRRILLLTIQQVVIYLRVAVTYGGALCLGHLLFLLVGSLIRDEIDTIDSVRLIFEKSKIGSAFCLLAVAIADTIKTTFDLIKFIIYPSVR